MNISNELGKQKKCEGCTQGSLSLGLTCTPIEFKFDYHTCEIDCYWKSEETFKNKIIFEGWLKNENIHRDDGPARIWYYGENEKAKIRHKEWQRYGQLHRIDDGPSNIWYYENGKKQYESWFKNGQRHNSQGSAVKTYYENGNIEYESWFKNGQWHRDIFPAAVYYNKNGDIIEERWYKDNQWIKTKNYNYKNPYLFKKPPMIFKIVSIIVILFGVKYLFQIF